MTTFDHKDRQAVLKQVPGWNIDLLSSARVLVVGAGALGNEVLKNLALLGVGEIVIVDFDRIEPSNLSRSVLFRESDTGQLKAEVAASRVEELNSRIKTRSINGDILCDVGLGLIREMDLIFGCLDNRLARLWLNRWAFRAGKNWIGGGILNLSGQVTVFGPGEACYECGLSDQGWQDIQKRLGCSDMAQRYFNAGIQPTTPIAASILGGVMVQEGLKLLFEQTSDRLKGQMWSYEGQQLYTAIYDLTASKEDCLSHHAWSAPQRVDGLGAGITLDKALELLEQKLGGSVWIELDHAVALEVATLTSKRVYPLLKPLLHLSEELINSFRKISGEGIGVPQGKLISRLGRDFPNPECSLEQLGIPPQHIIRVHCNEKMYYLELDQ